MWSLLIIGLIWRSSWPTKRFCLNLGILKLTSSKKRFKHTLLGALSCLKALFSPIINAIVVARNRAVNNLSLAVIINRSMSSSKSAFIIEIDPERPINFICGNEKTNPIHSLNFQFDNFFLEIALRRADKLYSGRVYFLALRRVFSRFLVIFFGKNL